MTARTFTLNVNFGLQQKLSIFSGFFFFFLTLLQTTTISAQILFCPYCPSNWKDTIAPHAVCKTAITATLDQTGRKFISPIDLDDFSTDNCPVIIISASKTSYTCADIGTQNVILFVRDTAGNRAQCTTAVTIRDTVRPLLLNCAKDTTLTVNATECTKTFTFAPPSVSDNCSTGLTVNQSSGLTSGSAFPVGTTTVAFSAKDLSNNTVTCSFKVTVKDVPPTVACKTGFSPKLISSSNRLVVNPLDVATSISDNCTPLSNLTLKIRRAGSGTGFPDSSSLSFGCGDTGRIAVEVWTKDLSGLTNSCTTTIYVNDSNRVCNIPLESPIDGRFLTEEQVIIGAKVDLRSTMLGIASQYSIPNGSYHLNLRRNNDYQITPSRGGDWLNGVTTFDVALISRHVLNSNPLTSPYKLIAADVNRDGSIDALDMLITRRVVLRQMDSFPNNRSWRFVPKSYTFPTGIDPISISFPEFLSYFPVTDTITNADFISMKIGDMNGSATNLPLQMSIEPRGQRIFVMETEDELLEAGKTYNIAVRTPKLEPEAFQFTLNYDKKSLKFHSIDPLDIYNFSSSNYAVFADRGNVTVSWNSLGSKAEPMNMFIFTVQALRSTRLSEVLHLTSDLTPAEAYSSAGEQMKVDLRFASKNTEGGNFHLFQNNPNPFSGTTHINFRLPNDSEATLTVFDETGRIIKKQTGTFKKGNNQITMNFSDTPFQRNLRSVSGVLFYRLDTPLHSATQRMVLLN
ncbi:MAG: HYR domain-containing protein [Saprospiraceae bacterium]|nr:HYR domain-containing protein [Saprospiraceae bacterium]